MNAATIVKDLLEDDYDAHVKAHQHVQKWDGAHSTFKELYRLRKKSMGLYREMGRAIGYERALARMGLKREDVQMPITGAQIGSTHNYKQTRPVRRCKNIHCNMRRPMPEEQQQCPNCGEELKTVQTPWSMSELRDKLGRHILGVETKDHRFVWFDRPVPPETETEPEEDEKVAMPPLNPKEFGEQGRLGKWW